MYNWRSLKIKQNTKSTVKTVICNPSRGLNDTVTYDRGSLNTVPIQ